MRIYESEGIGRVFYPASEKRGWSAGGNLRGHFKISAAKCGCGFRNWFATAASLPLHQFFGGCGGGPVRYGEKSDRNGGAVQGLIIGGVPHLHVTASDPDRAYVGHLEPESEVQYLAEICIMELKGTDLTRRKDEFGDSYIDKK